MKTEERNQEKYCSYRQLDNGIHEFVFHIPSREAVDIYVAHLYRLHTNAPDSALILTLVDASAGVVPLSYISQRMRELEKKLPKRVGSKSASLLPNTPLLTMVNAVTQMLTRGRSKARIFTPDQRDEAIAWLLADD